MVNPKAHIDFEDGEIATGVAWLGSTDLDETDQEGNNLNAWIGFLRMGVLYREIDGEAITRETLLKALVNRNKKAQMFFKEHFGSKMVQIRACDFRQDPTDDQSARVAVCEKPILSIRHVGQRYSALALDMDSMQVLTREEFTDIITGLAVFYDFSSAPAPGQALTRHKRVFTERVETACLEHKMKKVRLDADESEK